MCKSFTLVGMDIFEFQNVFGLFLAVDLRKQIDVFSLFYSPGDRSAWYKFFS